MAVGASSGADRAIGSGRTPSPFAARNWSHFAEEDDDPPGLSVRFMGTSTLLISDETTSVLIDGFFSRPSLTRFLATRLAPKGAEIAKAMRRGRIGPLTLVLAAHSHHDHAMDSATVAASQNAELAGSDSVRWLAEGADFPKERFRLVKDKTVLAVGSPVRFHITAFEAPHSPHPFFTGDLEAPLRPPIWGPSYLGGPNFSFLIEHRLAKMLVVPSANFVCEGLAGRRADVVFLSIGGIGRQPVEFFEAYWRETVLRPQASTVVITHWDDFFVSLDEPLRPMRRLLDDVETALVWVEAAARRDGVKLVIPPAFRPAAVDALQAGASRPVPLNHGTCIGDARA